LESAEQTIRGLLETLLRNADLELTFGFVTGSRLLAVTFEGADVPLLLARNAELLLALEHLAIQALRLTPEQHEQVSFDAGGFKARREGELRRAAEEAVATVRRTRRPFRFAPMTSRERRMLHLMLAPSGMRTASEGVGGGRYLVLHP
jgi:spoIIIJ-associated protein